ncbi:metal ABC transporter solute-binding protein, Zn/Mn family [Ferrimonas lipolytica]|uniref:Zinc ABC transporter solute-binding protein n=1 Tax=Ferrimonas lipolytica TaxID=2724191 RepID=A0A6H1UII7_9GAMM|nr:zinc ABC transporter substrate-binding protein [Ferrimonas lipolytica]QIZ78638.1 zinc ABC transporter solute-binding protein [Ferrimonas lipolytica]
MRTNSNLSLLSAVVITGLMLSPQALALKIFACEPEYAALAQELAPAATIFSATSALQDPHHVQARPSLIAKLRQADLAICAGAELEVGWLPMLQMKANNPQVRDGNAGMFYAMDYIEPLGVPDKVDRSMGDIHAGGNPHMHFSPQRIEQVAAALRDRLMSIDSDNAEAYQQQWQLFASRWQQAQQQWQLKAKPLQGKQVIAYHSSFMYLFDWLGMEQVGNLEPKPGLPPTSAHLSSLLQQVQATPPLALIYTGYQDNRGVNWLAKRTDVTALQLPFGPGVDGIDSLFELYDSVLDKLLAVPSS